MSVSKSTATPKKPIIVSKMAADKKPAAKKAPTKIAAKAAPAKAASAKPKTAAEAAPKIKADKPTAKTAPAKGKAGKSNGATPITPEQRYRMICDAAYFRAERRGFIGGNSAEDWTAAEVEIDGLLLSIKQ